MPIAPADLKIKYSTKSGSAGNSQAGTAAGSLGKYISTTEIADAQLHNLFDVVGAAENQSLESEYRCIFLHNGHGSITLQNAKVYISSQQAGGADIEIGIDATAAKPIGSSADQALSVADEDTPPAGVTFSAPTNLGAALAIGNLAPGECRAVWVKRTTTNSAAVANDNATLLFSGETT